MAQKFFNTTTTDAKIVHKLHHDTVEWKVSKDHSEALIRRVRDKLHKRELRKEADDRWFQDKPKRDMVRHVLNSPLVEGAVFVVICTDFMLTVHETDLEAASADKPQWLPICSVSFLAFYVMELSLRLFVHGPRFFSKTSNLVDLILVIIDAACAIVDFFTATYSVGVAFFRIFRVMRLVRALRIIRHFHELYLMLYGLISTFKAIFWAMVLIFMVLNCCSIIAVNFVHPINLEVVADGVYEGSCTRCPHAFRTVREANITFIQQILAGDSWGQITLPIVEKAHWTLYFFVFVLLTVNLGLLNLVLAVIVDQASQAAHGDVQESLLTKMQAFRSAREDLMQLCAGMDTDSSGQLTLAELMHGYDSNSEFKQYLNAMDVCREDLGPVFRILDRDGSGDVTYSEFVEQMHRLKTQDPHTMLFFMRSNMQEMMGLLGDIADKMEATDNYECFPNLKIPVPTEACERSQSATDRTDDDNQMVDTSTKFETGGIDDDSIDSHAEQRAEATLSNEHCSKQSSARQSEGAFAKKDVLLPADVNRPPQPRSTTPVGNSPLPSTLRQRAARFFTQPELKDLQDSIAKAIEVIVRDSLVLSGERVLELTKHHDFIDLLHGLDTSPWTGDMSGDRFLPVQPMEHKGVSNFSVNLRPTMATI